MSGLVIFALGDVESEDIDWLGPPIADADLGTLPGLLQVKLVLLLAPLLELVVILSWRKKTSKKGGKNEARNNNNNKNNNNK